MSDGGSTRKNNWACEFNPYLGEPHNPLECDKIYEVFGPAENKPEGAGWFDNYSKLGDPTEVSSLYDYLKLFFFFEMWFRLQ